MSNTARTAIRILVSLSFGGWALYGAFGHPDSARLYCLVAAGFSMMDIGYALAKDEAA